MSREPRILLPARRQLVKDCAWSRLGLDIRKPARQSLIRRVWKGDVKYARKLTHSRTVIVLDYEGREIAEIISFLSPDAPETAEWRRAQSAALVSAHPARHRREGVRW
jgi:hypothetical protein